MKKILSFMLAAALLFTLAACADKDASPARETGQSAESSEETLAAVSMNRFKTEIKNENLGKVKDLSGNSGYDAALATDSRNINYIYMFMPKSDMAESIITDSDGDGKKDDDLTLEKKGENYEYYTQDGSEKKASSSSADSTYGKCLRVGSMIIIVSGPLSEKKTVNSQAHAFFRNLGYDLGW